ncbi:hypothetical protein [Chryseobacterium indologenes]|uniref:hypothetical protein n=1 Tax=Chryseobacterium indologenes TaxID=253 RepID=UPI001BCE38C3|nr:hypothetical protein [Chryseobacterium indologenes]
MKKIIISILMCYGFSLNAQTGSVGINTSNPDPSAVLDVNSANKGLLIPRVSLQSLSDASTVPSPANGLFVYNTNSNLSSGTGLYVNSGTAAAPNWHTFLPYSVNYVLDNAYSTTATNSVQYPFPASGTTVNNIDLALGLTVVVPAMSTVQIVVNYSTPVGFLKPNISENFGGYMGVRFLRAVGANPAAEAQGGSRKYSISQIFNENVGSYVMTSVGATFVETVTNNTSTAGSVTYSLNGYIEKTQGTNTTPNFIFNMFSATGQNYNWGRGTMSAQVFRKPL